jgi:hypothetical protein
MQSCINFPPGIFRVYSLSPQRLNITQLYLMNQSTGLVAHRIEVVAEGTSGRQLEPQMFEPKSERDRLFEQQSGVPVFAAAVETAQHQKKIDDIGIGARPACLYLDLIDLELAQLQLQFGQIKGLAGEELCVG